MTLILAAQTHLLLPGSASRGLRRLAAVLPVLTTTIIVLSLIGMLMAALYAARDRLVDDWLLAILALTEVGLLVQLVFGLARIGELDAERVTFAAYVATLPLVSPFTVLLAIKEKTRWSMGTIGIGAATVAVMTVRVAQIWSQHG